jgi:hypothetical protein
MRVGRPRMSALISMFLFYFALCKLNLLLKVLKKPMRLVAGSAPDPNGQTGESETANFVFFAVRNESNR